MSKNLKNYDPIWNVWRETLAKKAQHFAEAERLYVIEQCTLGEIASRLRIHEKTAANWKEEGDWESKRAKHLKGKQAFHEELYEFTRLLMRSIKEDIEAGKQVDPGRMFAFNNLVGKLKNVKQYEDIITQKQKDDEKKNSSGLNDEVLRLIESQVFGH